MVVMTMQSMLQGMLKKALRLAAAPAGLLILAQLTPAQESATFKKIRDTSRDKKFAVRISCERMRRKFLRKTSKP